MAAYDLIMDLIKEYFIDLGYSNLYVEQYFSNRTFKELLSIRLANANVMIRNKTDRSSHLQHPQSYHMKTFYSRTAVR